MCTLRLALSQTWASITIALESLRSNKRKHFRVPVWCLTITNSTFRLHWDGPIRFVLVRTRLLCYGVELNSCVVVVLHAVALT